MMNELGRNDDQAYNYKWITRILLEVSLLDNFLSQV